MQSSALAAVLAKLHCNNPAAVAARLLSARTRASMASLLAGNWAATTNDAQ